MVEKTWACVGGMRWRCVLFVGNRKGGGKRQAIQYRKKSVSYLRSLFFSFSCAGLVAAGEAGPVSTPALSLSPGSSTELSEVSDGGFAFGHLPGFFLVATFLAG